MTRHRVDRGWGGPLLGWFDLLNSWLGEAGLSPGRASRTVNAFARLSLWMQDCGIGVADLDEDVIDEHIVVPPRSWRVSYAACGLVLDSLIS